MRKLSDIMTRDVAVVDPSTDLYEVSKKMKQEDSGVLPVCDGSRIQGVITDRDIVIRALADDRDPRMTHASEIMTQAVCYCYEDEDIQDAAKKMQEQQVRRLVVVDQNKNLVGILSIGDLASRIRKPSLAGKTLREIASKNAEWNYTQSESGFVRSLLIGSTLALVGFALFSTREQIRSQFQKMLPRMKEKASELTKAA